MMPTLTTARLILRPFEPADDAAHAMIWAKPEVLRYLPGGEKEVVHADRNARLYGELWRGGAERRGIVPFAAVERASGRLIGHLGARINPELKEPELTLFLDSQVWRQGYATEGAAAALDYAFGELGLTDVLGLTTADNLASIRVLRKLGFEGAGPRIVWDMALTSFRLGHEAWQARRSNLPLALVAPSHLL